MHYYTVHCQRENGQSITILRPTADTPAHRDAAEGEANRLMEAMREAGLKGLVRVELFQQPHAAAAATEESTGRLEAWGL